MSGARNLQAYLPGSPIVVDAPNGDLRVEWRHFFAQLWERTGGSQGAPPGGGSGTITGVTAGAGLAGGGTSGVVALSLTIPVTIGNGGTGATTAPQALQNLGGISDAPSTSQAYGRFNATWAQVLSLQYGGIIQGPVQLLSAPVLPTDAATKGYVDAAIAGGGDWVDAPSDGNAWGRQNATWVQVLPLVGGTLSGTLHLPVLSLLGNALSTALYASSGNLSVMVDNVVSWQFSAIGATAIVPLAMGGNAITALANPVNAQDAATKAYVDANAGGIADAPSDGNAYGRLNAAWTQVLPLLGGTVSGEVLSAITPASADALITKRYVDTSLSYLPLAGGTLTGPLALPNGTVAIPSLQLGANDGTGISRSANAVVMGVQGATVFATFFNAAQFFQPLFMLNNRIQQLADPTAAADALNLRTADARYAPIGAGPFLPLAGGTMTGALTLAADGAANLAPVTVQQFNGVIAQMLPLTGGTMTGPIVLSGNATANLNPVSLQQWNAALALMAPLASPTFTGTPAAPTPAGTDSSTTIATTAFVAGTYAPRVSPALTGNPTAPTATAGTSTAQIATTQFVASAIAGTAPGVASFNTRTGAVTLNNADVTTVLAGATLTGPLTLAVDGSTALMPVTVQQFNLTVALLAPLASPALTGTPTAPTAPAGTNSTRIATTAYADNLNALTWG